MACATHFSKDPNDVACVTHFSKAGASKFHSDWWCGVAGEGREGGRGGVGGGGRELLPLPRTCWNCGARGGGRAGAKWDVPSGTTLETTQGQIHGFLSQLQFKCCLPEVASVGD